MSNSHTARAVAEAILKRAGEMYKSAALETKAKLPETKDLLATDKGLEPKAGDAKGQARIEDGAAAVARARRPLGKFVDSKMKKREPKA